LPDFSWYAIPEREKYAQNYHKIYQNEHQIYRNGHKIYPKLPKIYQNGNKIYQNDHKMYQNGHKIYQHFPFQGTLEFTQIGSFWYENIPSGNPEHILIPGTDVIKVPNGSVPSTYVHTWFCPKVEGQNVGTQIDEIKMKPSLLAAPGRG
jgi:hypothetical protein